MNPYFICGNMTSNETKQIAKRKKIGSICEMFLEVHHQCIEVLFLTEVLRIQTLVMFKF